jgi:hypothetical protein
MSRPHLTGERAGRIVRARLGRPAQDLLEAAVVLEAWGGVPSDAALALDADVLPASAEPHAAARSWAAGDEEGRESVLAEGLGLLVAIVAVATWAGPLSRQLGATRLEHALRLALPLTLALQWAVRSRYLGRPSGLRCLAQERMRVLLAAVAIGVPLAFAPRIGPLAGVLVLIWVGGTVLARRGWGLVYAALVLGEALALGAHAPARWALAGLAAAVLAGCVIAVARARGPAPEAPGRVSRALAAGLVGALLGGLLVGDRSLGWGVHGAFPGLALVPSVIGGLWGGCHLWQLHTAIPRGLRGVPLAQASAPMPDGPAARILRGALVRLVGATVVLSALAVAVEPWTQGTDQSGLFAAFGCVALLSLLVGLHESLGHPRWALAVAATSLALELAVNRWIATPPPGLALTVAGAAGTLLALAPLLRRLRAPGRMLATALWIK